MKKDFYNHLSDRREEVTIVRSSPWKRMLLRRCMVIAFLAVITPHFMPAEASAEPNPCELFTKSDAEALFNEKVTQGDVKRSTMTGSQTCRYAFKKNGGNYSITICVATTEGIRAAGSLYKSAKDVIDRHKKALKASNAEDKDYREIQGLGDDAFWNGSELWILKGDAYVEITAHPVIEGQFKNMDEMTAVGREKKLECAKKAAAVILPRLN